MIRSMFHTPQSARGRAQAQAPSRAPLSVVRRLAQGSVALAVIIGAAGCGDDLIAPDAFRFGQLGEIEIVLERPLPEQGSFVQILRWGWHGERSLQESISYRGLIGDERFERRLAELDQSATAYATVITHLTDDESLKLDIGELPRDLNPECGPGRTRVRFTIIDEVRVETRTWIRCVDGSLGTIEQAGAGPDPAASRVAQAVQLVRDATFGEAFVSHYAGTIPFGTLDRGEDSGASLSAPVAFTNFDLWQTFWVEHAGTRPIPAVDFAKEMVLVAMVGPREEAGDSVEIRRILPVDNGTITEYVERVPGNFCSPAARRHVPYHIVVAPRTPAPFVFSELRREEVPCGG